MKKILFIVWVIILSSCKDKKFNIFTLKDDMELGAQMDAEIRSNPFEYPILNRNSYPDAYNHIERIRNKLLASDDLKHKDIFNWQVTIIHNDNVLNAFCTPGGYMYFYTGIIKYLDNEAQFAGVMAHEMAHADKRHVTQTLTTIYSVQVLLSFALGKNPSQLAQIVADMALGLGTLKFSRTHEYEADEMSVKYLADTDYHPKSIAGFFEKIESSAAPKTPEFLSTHPNPGNRLDNINNVWVGIGSPSGNADTTNYMLFKQSLP